MKKLDLILSVAMDTGPTTLGNATLLDRGVMVYDPDTKLMKKSRVLNAIFLALMAVCFFSSGVVVSANATTLTWHSDYGSNGLIASFTIPTDTVFTEWNEPIKLSGSEYTFMLGDSSHAPTQGVAAQTFGRSDILGLIAYSGWYWDQSKFDWVNNGPFVRADFSNFDYPSGLVPVTDPQPVQLYDALIHFYSDIIIYAYSNHYLSSVPW